MNNQNNNGMNMSNMNNQNNNGMNMSNINNQNSNGMNPLNSNLTNNTNTGVSNNSINSQSTSQMNTGMYSNQMNNSMNYGGNTVNSQYNMPSQNSVPSYQNSGMNQGSGNGMDNGYSQQSMTNDYLSTSMNQGKQPMDKKILVIIIGIVVLALCALIGVSLLSKDDEPTQKQNVNEYEETTDNETNDDNINIDNDVQDTTSDTQVYLGFEFQKLPEYTYSVEDDTLYAKNSSYSVLLNVVYSSFDVVRQDSFISKLKSNFETNGYVVGTMGLENILGSEVFISEVTYNGTNALYYAVKANESYVFEGLVLNYLNTFDHSINMAQVLAIVKNAKYVGNYSGYGTSFSNGVDLSKLQ